MRAPISVQLYSLRKEAAADFPAVIERLGRIGFAGVEPAGVHDLSPAEFRRLVEGAGMVVSSSHSPTPVGDEANRILDAQEELGCNALVVPMLAPERFAGSDAVKAAAAELNAALENVNARGLRLGYHNHWWEFEVLADGRTAHELLFDELAPEIFAEVDIYWARVGGRDPARVISDLGARARLLHVKDGPADDVRAPMTAVGEGTIDVKAALGAATAAEWHIVELDRCDGDMFEAIERSYGFLVGAELSRGRV